MEACKIIVTSAFFILFPIGTYAADLSPEQEASVSTLFELLFTIYDYDTSQIPDEPNEIQALETSSDSMDRLAWEIFKLIRDEMDPDSRPPAAIKKEPVVLNDPEQPEEDAIPSQIFPIVRAMSMESEPAEPLIGPLSSCILEPGTYRLATLPLQIEGHVVIPAGTRLIVPTDPNENIIEVLPGGLLDMGRAAFYDAQTYPDVLPAVEIIPDDPNQVFAHNLIGIYVHRGADPRTRIENVIVKNCRVGIMIDEPLNNPVSRVITFGCYDGIHLYAPGCIRNCELWFCGTVNEGFSPYPGMGIYVCQDTLTYPKAAAQVDQVFAFDGDIGIYYERRPFDPNLIDPNGITPDLQVINSCIAQTYFQGIYRAQSDLDIEISHCAFCDNYGYDINFVDEFPGCFTMNYTPIYNFEDNWEHLYIIPGSPLTDAGYGIAADGTSTCHDRPDTGILDIGCHFPLGLSGHFGVASCPADFDSDGIVDENDLALMNACMGAAGDPNIVQIDATYDSWINWQDFPFFSPCYGWAHDPNVSLRADPNCAYSDFNNDGLVDLGDLAVMAEYWLSPVFDEYRLCGLCNLYTNQDPNLPDGTTIINRQDMDVFMQNWGKRWLFDPNITIAHSASAFTAAINKPDPAWRISAYLDGDPIGQWEDWDLAAPVFDADLTQYGPGSHKLRIVRNIGYGMEITEQIISDPNSIGLYYTDIPDTFEPNEPYCIEGFNLGGELNVEIMDIYEQTVYDVNCPPGLMNLVIPAETFDNIRIGTLFLTSSEFFNQESLYTVAAAESPSRSDRRRYRRLLRECFDPNDWDGQRVRTVFLLPDNHVTNIFWQAICSAIKAVENQELNYVMLTEHDVNTINLHYLFNTMPGRRIVIYFGHANSYVGNVQRTRFQCFRESRVIDPGVFYDVGAVSYTIYSKPGAIPLPPFQDTPQDVSLDVNAFDIQGYVPKCKIDKMFIFGCLSAAYDDMAKAQGCGSEHDYSYGDMMYCGFRYPVMQANGNWAEGIGDNVVRGISIFFDELGQFSIDANGTRKQRTIWDGIEVIQRAEIGIRRQCLGFNGQYDADPSDLDHQVLNFYGLHALEQKLQ